MMSRGCRQIGRRETAALYLAGGVCGGLASTALQRPYAEGVGASGAVYALEACNCVSASPAFGPLISHTQLPRTQMSGGSEAWQLM